ncbi:hypothetical protein SIM91_02840 [Rhodococcus opacus]|uniref:hypothetical protein n=1 Tax=Rhodococcus opacus TaxID=37919 RepID=UPI0007CD6D6F|nr:hypothetical protein [Rhodococcus opacus]MDX5962279.1 hypothetical protein [Rhodococcus opacus]NKY74827.1 hypothetical protein [Rhodococcus opacus]CAG7641766.1 hypothetical protein E143388_08317 [Rhodococcus opacus]
MSAFIEPRHDRTPEDRNRKPWQPTYTEKEAVKHGVPKSMYEKCSLWARTVVEHHQDFGTPRHLWEPPSTQVEHLVGPYIAAGENDLHSRLVSDVDPRLDRAQQAIEQTKARLDTAEQHPYPVTTAESHTTYSGADAVDVVEKATAAIELDFAAGKAHHQRSRPARKRAGTWAPWFEGVGFLAFVAYYLNVPLLEPWQDWLAWTFAMTVVVVIILGQTMLVHHAAESHNRAREAAADGNRHQSEAAYGRRNRYLGATAAVAGAITSGMILRGIAALGNASIGTTVVMVFLAIVAGAVMPMLAYLAVALDGSMRSRERDTLVQDLDADFDEQSRVKDECRDDLELITDITAILTQQVFPDVCTSVQATVDAAHTPYNFGRIQIGGLVADPPTRNHRTINQGPDGTWSGAISTGLPGVRGVDLLPMLDRITRLRKLDLERGRLAERLNDIPDHPWTKSSHNPK